MKLTSSSMNTFVPLPFISDIGNVILKLFNQLKPLFSSEIKLYSQDRLLTELSRQNKTTVKQHKNILLLSPSQPN